MVWMVQVIVMIDIHHPDDYDISIFLCFVHCDSPLFSCLWSSPRTVKPLNERVILFRWCFIHMHLGHVIVTAWIWWVQVVLIGWTRVWYSIYSDFGAFLFMVPSLFMVLSLFHAASPVQYHHNPSSEGSDEEAKAFLKHASWPKKQ